jgi:arsenate reductase (thioredoxin)
MNILILCTGNSCRSQMAEGFLAAFNHALNVFSAGTAPAAAVHPLAIKVMEEIGIDLREHQPEHVDAYLDKPFDYVITVCGGAKESCPVFTGDVKHRIHIGFEDPAEATGTAEEVLNVFRTIRDQIERDFGEFYREQLKRQL